MSFWHVYINSWNRFGVDCFTARGAKLFCMWNIVGSRRRPPVANLQASHHAHARINTLRPRQNVRHFPDDTFKCVFLNEIVWNLLNISLKFVPRVRINTIPALVQIMTWRRPGAKPLSEPMVVSLLMHICVTRPQWVNRAADCSYKLHSEFSGNTKVYHDIMLAITWTPDILP